MQPLLIENNGVTLSGVSQGKGPLVIFWHGFPGLAYSWRYQIPVLAAAGYTAVAFDSRGYGGSSRPLHTSDYSFSQQLGDLQAILNHMGHQTCVLIGHDFGANFSWHVAARRPELLNAVVSVSVPYGMPLAGFGEQQPTQMYRQIAGEHFFHMHYFQTEGAAEKELEGREREFLQKLFWALSAEGQLLDWQNYSADGTGYMDVLGDAPSLPWPWLSESEFDTYVNSYLTTPANATFIGGLNAYRAMDENWREQQAYANKTIDLPALFLAGEDDPVLALTPAEILIHMKSQIPNLQSPAYIPAAGHFVQQEQPHQVNQLLITFLASLDLSERLIH